MKEIWKKIKGHEDYIVSSEGKIAKILSGTDNGKGYKTIIFPNGDRQYKHRIVAQAFIDNPNNYPIINHINGNKNDNRAKNLEWCTQSHNVKEAFRLGTHKPVYVKVVQKDLDGNIVKIWNSMKEIQDTLNIDYRRISKCCRKVRKTCCHYKWEYYETEEN